MPGKDTKVPSTLSGHAAEIWRSAFDSAWKQYDPDKHSGTQEEYSSKVAWSAVKKSYEKNKDGKWVKKSEMRQFSLRITKSRVDGETGQIKWHANAATDEVDEDEKEVLHPELFDDLAHTFLLTRAAYDDGTEPPVYDEDLGPAQEPILDIAHYSSLLGSVDRDKARLGYITKLYRDGRYLHAEGYFDETKNGQLVAKSIAADEAGEIRVSVGFFPDWGNIEVKNDVLYFKGGRDRAYLDHLAVTSCPRIPTTSIEAEEVTMSEVAATMAEDALRVLGEDGQEIVDELQELVDERMKQKSMVLKSEGDVEEVVEEEVVEEIVEESTEEIMPVMGAETVPTEPEMVTEALVEVEEVYVGPTSFQEALAQVDAAKEAGRISDGWYLLQGVMSNILKDTTIEDKNAAIDGAMAEFQSFLKSDQHVWSEAEIETEIETVTEESIEEEVTPVEEPVVEEAAPVEEIVVEEPVQDEVQPFSNLDAEHDPALQSQHRLGRATSFGQIVDKLGSGGRMPPVQQVTPAIIAESVENVPVDSDIGNVMAQMLTEAMQPILAELANLRQSIAVKDEPVVPQRPERKSKATPSVDPSRVITRQQTFGEVVDKLTEVRQQRQ